MISDLELRHIIESGFLPVKCLCTISAAGTMTVQLIEPERHEIEFTVPGIPTADLTSSRAIADLIAHLREEYRLNRVVRTERRKYS